MSFSSPIAVLTVRPTTRVIAAFRVCLLGVALSFAFDAVGLRARAAATLTLGSPAAGPGEVAQIPVSLQGDAAAVAVQFDVRFDAARLTPGLAAPATGAARHVVVSSTPAPGIARVVIYSLANQALGNGVLVTLPMRVTSPSPTGTSPLVVSNVLVAAATATPVTPVVTADGAVVIRDSAAARLQIPVLAANGQVTIRLNGQEGRSYVLQRSGDLLGWEVVSTQTAVGGVAVFTDPGPGPDGSGRRFYRALEGP